jgi:zinc-finger of a C2HC-type
MAPRYDPNAYARKRAQQMEKAAEIKAERERSSSARSDFSGPANPASPKLSANNANANASPVSASGQPDSAANNSGSPLSSTSSISGASNTTSTPATRDIPLSDQLEDISQRLQQLSQAHTSPGAAQRRHVGSRPTTAQTTPTDSLEARAIELAKRRTLREGPLVPLFPWEVADLRAQRKARDGSPTGESAPTRTDLVDPSSSQESMELESAGSNVGTSQPHRAPSDASTGSLSLLKARNRSRSRAVPKNARRNSVASTSSAVSDSLERVGADGGRRASASVISLPEGSRGAPHSHSLGDQSVVAQSLPARMPSPEDERQEELPPSSTAGFQSAGGMGDVPEYPPGGGGDPDEYGPPPTLEKCHRCGRSFATERMAKHETACAKAAAAAAKRKVFDVSKQRAGDEAAQLKAQAERAGKHQATPKRGQKARRERQQFINAIRAGTNKAPLRDEYSGAGADQIEDEPDPDMGQCAHCGRTFNNTALARHETICQRVFGTRGRGSPTRANAPPKRTTSTRGQARGRGRGRGRR